MFILLAFALGILTPIWLVPLVMRAAIWLFTRDGKSRKAPSQLNAEQDSLYGLDHAILNAHLPPATMWMTMGYWKDASQLPEACEALVDKILDTAGLSKPTSRTTKPTKTNPSNGATKKKRVLLDLGFGCGQQTLYLMKNSEKSNNPAAFDAYVGITIEKSQYEFASSRLRKGAESMTKEETGSVRIFCADAALPESWSDELKSTIGSQFRVDLTKDNEKRDRHGDTDEEVGIERYVLGLDTLYHFSPSRRPIFEYAHSTLHANFLAFDLFLAPASFSSSKIRRFHNMLFLRFLTPALGAPFSNFVTPEDYKKQLVEAGYSADDITIEDITDSVFGGLARFLETRQREVTALGLKGFTKWQISGWLFRWLSNGETLRAGIVVAKKKGAVGKII